MRLVVVKVLGGLYSILALENSLLLFLLELSDLFGQSEKGSQHTNRPPLLTSFNHPPSFTPTYRRSHLSSLKKHPNLLSTTKNQSQNLFHPTFKASNS